MKSLIDVAKFALTFSRISEKDVDFADRIWDLQKALEKVKALGFLSDKEFPEVICLCGSTRFEKEFIELNKRFTIEGKIVLSVGCFGHADGMSPEQNLGIHTKIALDKLHKQKICMADTVYVINRGGYIGESTKSEINFARVMNKTIKFMEKL